MSKLTKLIKNPKLYFVDFVKKRTGHSVTPNAEKKAITTLRMPSKAISNTGPKASTVSIVNLITENFNRFKRYKFYFHTGENMTSGPNHLNMWLPLLMSFRIPFLLIIRDQKLYDWVLKNYHSVDVVFAKTAGDISEIVARTEGTPMALYSSSTGNNIHLVRFEEIKHCFIGHGDSEKAASAHKALRMFDEIWVASQAHIDRFYNKSFNSKGLDFVKVGRPTLIQALRNSVKPWQERGETKILYLPTWEGINYKNDYSSVRMAKQLLEITSEKAVTHAKLHPNTGSRDKSLADAQILIDASFKENSKISVIPSSVPLLDIHENYNIFVCDISSVVTECLALDAPIFLYYPKNVEIEIAASNMDFEDYCYVFSSLDDFQLIFDRVISGDDYKKEERKKAIDYFIGIEESLEIKLRQVLAS